MPASNYAVRESASVNQIVDLAHVASRRDPRPLHRSISNQARRDVLFIDPE
jgi:hypothetical protein